MDLYSLRDRKGSSLSYEGACFLENYNGTGGHTETFQFFDNYEVVDVVHKNWESGDGDQGGPFYLQKNSVKVYPANINQHWASGATSYRGPVGIGGFNFSVPETGVDVSKVSDLTMDSLGSTLLSRAIPTNPTFDLAAFIGELRQPGGVPRISGMSLLRERARYLRNSGDEYLNVEFGWKPLVSDLRNFAYAVKNSKKILDSYRKDANHKIRRRKALPSSSSTVQLRNVSFYSFPAQWYGVFIGGDFIRTDMSETWFSGAFRYFLPVDDSIHSKFQRWSQYADKLLGVRLTPDVVWELTPWSWAIDWFSNTGNVMNNISRLGHDGLVMQYGYVMHHAKRVDSASGKFSWWDRQTNPEHVETVSTVWTEELKQRKAATPYGFGVDLKALSAQQISILAALGLSRA